jgi:hypothetical protein
MAAVYGTPGEGARVKGVLVGLAPLFAAVFLAGFCLAGVVSGPRPFLSSLAFTCVLAAAATLLCRGVGKVENFFKGARGEEKVAGILAGLPDGYHVFNDVSSAAGQIDHVVVGPAGVFAVETKNWSSAVTFENGSVFAGGRAPSRSPLDQVRREADAVYALLRRSGWKGEVTPLLVFASDTFRPRVAEIEGVVAMNAAELAGAFAASRAVMGSGEIDRLARLLEMEV